MQNVSQAYIKSMNKAIRNRGYIRCNIGVVNEAAQGQAICDSSELADFSQKNYRSAFYNDKPMVEYAVGEQDFTTVDSKMRFMPDDVSECFNSGIATKNINDDLNISFGSDEYDIRGFTIDFSDHHPQNIQIIAYKKNGDYSVKKSYKLSNGLFTTEDIFNAVNKLKIVNLDKNNQRLRIYSFSCGVVNTYTDDDIISYTQKEYSSAISATLPSFDATIKISNIKYGYLMDDKKSPLRFLQVGQPISIQFGYDLVGNSNSKDIEWLPVTNRIISGWSSNENEIVINVTDELAEHKDELFERKLAFPLVKNGYDVRTHFYNVADKGLLDSNTTMLSTLGTRTIYAPIQPKTKNNEAMQQAANYALGALRVDRNGKVVYEMTVPPKYTVSANEEATHSNASNLSNGAECFTYGVQGCGVNDTIRFWNNDNSGPGFCSKAAWVDGKWDDGIEPTLTIDFRDGTKWDKMNIVFGYYNSASKMRIVGYLNGKQTKAWNISNKYIDAVITSDFGTVNKLVITFTQGINKRPIVVKKLSFGSKTDFVLSEDDNILEKPVINREKNIKEIYALVDTATGYNFELNDIPTKKYTITPIALMENEVEAQKHVLTFDGRVKEVYPKNATDKSTWDSKVNVSINENTVTLTSKKYAADDGSEHDAEEVTLPFIVVWEKTISSKVADNGDGKQWKNPLFAIPHLMIDDTQEEISDAINKIQETLDYVASEYKATDYTFKWRGDARVDVGDKILYKKANGESVPLRIYQNELSYDGAWSGVIKAKEV